jgi:methyl-accepting chemotaxis protein
MKFKSIQFSVAALAGAIVLSVVAALVLYALFSGARTQDMVQQRTQAQFEQVIEQRLTSLAQTQVSQIQRELEAPLLIAGGLVRVNALLGTPGADGQPRLSLSREQLISLIKENVARTRKSSAPTSAGKRTHWITTTRPTSAAPCRHRPRQRTLPAVVVPQRGRQPRPGQTGRRRRPENPVHRRARQRVLPVLEGNQKSCVIDPAPYKVGDKIVMLASFIEPIMLNGAFQGIVGADLSVNFIQDMLAPTRSSTAAPVKWP